MADKLNALQRRFWQLITAPTGVKDALPELQEKDPGIAPLTRWIAGPNPSFAQERLDIYANMYFYRLLETIQSDYPKTFEIVGDQHFHNLITDYLLAHPSDSPSLRHLGRHLPKFLHNHSLNEQWPFLADLAALEWQRIDIFDGEDQTPMTEEALSQLPPEAWADSIFHALSSLRIQKFSYPVHLAWLALEEKRDLPTLEALDTTIIFWRPDFKVYHRPIVSPEIEAVTLLAKGVSFSTLCECFLGSDEDINAAAQRVFTVVKQWLSQRLLFSFVPPEG